MKLSTPTSPKPKDPLSILLIGPPGGGKTTLLLQFPKLHVVDLDCFLDGPERFVRETKKDLSYSYEPMLRDDKGKISVEKAYYTVTDHLQSLEPNNDISTVGFDSLTVLDEIIARKIMTDQKRESLEPRDWDTFRSDMLKVVMVRFKQLNQTGKIVVCICHEFDREQPNPKNIMEKLVIGYRPSVRGSVGRSLGGFFSDVWRCHTKVAPGDRLEYFLTPVRTEKSDYLKNSLGITTPLLAKQGEMMFDKLTPYLKGRI